MTDLAWIAELKPGDDVIVAAGWTYKDYRVAKVAKVTRTQIVIKSGRVEHRYEKATGIVRGANGYHRAELRQATPERVAQIRRKEAIDFISKYGDMLHRVDSETLPNELLDVIVNAMKGTEK